MFLKDTYQLDQCTTASHVIRWGDVCCSHSCFCFAGKYELCGVLTHKGRSADSGHYVSWVKQSDNTWIQFDDDQLIPRKEDEIVTLSGGGDWHMAYLLLYRAQRVS